MTTKSNWYKFTAFINKYSSK